MIVTPLSVLGAADISVIHASNPPSLSVSL